MKLIVGLGNIGERYEKTRHNAGFVVLDRLQGSSSSSASFKLQDKFSGEIFRDGENIFLKPVTMMNESGKSISAVANFYKISPSEIYVIYDDLDIRLGEYKIQFEKGPKVHNGLSSVRQHLGTNSFWHVRIGVDNREVKGNTQIPGVEYSLREFPPEERQVFEEVVQRVTEEILSVVS